MHTTLHVRRPALWSLIAALAGAWSASGKEPVTANLGDSSRAAESTSEPLRLQIFDPNYDPPPKPSFVTNFADEPSDNAVSAGLADSPAKDAFRTQFSDGPNRAKPTPPQPLVKHVSRRQNPASPLPEARTSPQAVRTSVVRAAPVDPTRIPVAKPAASKPAPQIAVAPKPTPKPPTVQPAKFDLATVLRTSGDRPATDRAVVQASFSDVDRASNIPEMLQMPEGTPPPTSADRSDPVANVIRRVFSDSPSDSKTTEKPSPIQLARAPRVTPRPIVQFAPFEKALEPPPSTFLRLPSGRLVRREELPLNESLLVVQPTKPASPANLPQPLQGTLVAKLVQPDTPFLLAEDEDAARNLAALDEDFKPIKDVVAVIRHGAGERPADFAAHRFAKAGTMRHEQGTSRSWAISHAGWEATAMYHNPLYFEEVNAERHGFSGGAVQPFASAAHFFVRVPALPYLMTVDCPWEKLYTLGHYRPGNDVPFQVHRVPLKPSAAVVQAGVMTGMWFLIP